MAEAENKEVENQAVVDPNAEIINVEVELKFKAPRKTIVEAAIKKGETCLLHVLALRSLFAACDLERSAS